ncbi:MAG: hypothetical protein JWM83_327 [Candidatus Angelobacter sp.]|jgi:hypothetical protein|nr:hypothetical protein [Candidatus Angelobacter sp.]
MKDRKFHGVTTLPISEEGHTFPVGEGDTTEAIGEEGPTSPDSESPSAFSHDHHGRRGGPFGAF